MSDKGNTSEEIDLSQLFRLIGDGFNRLIQFIVSVCKGIFHSVILFLQFIRKHFIKFVIAGVVGLLVGWYLDYKSPALYSTSMVIEPNFSSVQQLYNDIEYYNGLAIRGEKVALAEALKISDTSVAATIRKITIRPFSEGTQKLREYSSFIKQLDTASRKGINYEFYLKNSSLANSKFHSVIIHSTDPETPKKCQEGIVESILENEYFKQLKAVNDLNIKEQELIIDNQLKEIDSLQVFYQKMRVLEANKPQSATSINLAERKVDESMSELDLLRRKKELREDKLVLNTRKVKEENIINIISDFNDKGALDTMIFRQNKLLFPSAFIILTFIILVLIQLNKYLKNYNNLKV